MSLIASRLTTTGNLLVNGGLDEFSGIQPLPVIDNTLAYWVDAGVPSSYPGYGATVYDLSTKNNPLTIISPVPYTAAGTASYWNFNQNGTGLSGVLMPTTVTGSTAITFPNVTATFIAWVYATTTNLNAACPLFARGGYTRNGLSTGGMNATGLWFPSGNNIGYHWLDQSNTYSWISGLVVPANAWCMIAITVTPNLATAYLCQASGITSATNAVSHPSPGSQQAVFAFGGDPFLSYRNWIGNLNQGMVYTRALTAAEIATNYNAGAARFGLPLTPLAPTQVTSGAVDRVTINANATQATYLTSNVMDEWTGAGVVDTSLQIWLDAGQTASTAGASYNWQNLVPNGIYAQYGNNYDQSTFDPMANAYNFNSLQVNPVVNPPLLGTSFDGFNLVSDTRGGISYPALSNNPTFTIELWVKHTAVNPNGDRSKYSNIYSIWEQYSKTGYRYGVSYNASNVGQPIFWSDQCGGNIGATISTPIMNMGQWYHVVTTFNGNTIQMYINGVAQPMSMQNAPQGSLICNLPPTSSAPLYIGTDADGVQSFTGQMSVFKWYTRPLTANEVVTNFNAVCRRYGYSQIAQTTGVIAKRANTTGNVLLNGTFDEITGAPVVDPSLVFWVDAAQPASYAGGAMTSTTPWNSLVNYPTYSLINTVANQPNSGYIANQPVFNPAQGGYFDFTAGNVQLPPYTAGTFGFTVYPAPEPVPVLGSFTLQAWVNRNSAFVPTGDRETIFSNASGGSGFRFGIGSAANNNAIYYLLGTNSPNYYQEGYLGTTPVTDGKWHLLTVVFDRNAQLGSYTIYGYMDTALTGSAAIANGATASVVPLPSRSDGSVTGVGNQGCCRQFGGKLSLIMVYNRALTQSDITANYLATSNRYLY